ncbi:kinase-like domain-containing protein [Cokeromyces recurvatus]|uniref:kinase-like domain-containing protein n=1 Tax=Cokeromyces recurvatus TaxID=90255 RepID=UPI002220D1A9|nr:kinase-like domain-containing protein [Cokeromyces recurvatus]KAI7899578.1 kinase-like domain-containing protein [Cokeromyces recurvatus]
MGNICCKEEPVDLLSEVQLSHFILLRSVGKGAFGKVRVVQHKGNKKLYALKYINKDKCIQMKAIDNILSERKLLEHINFNLIVNLRYAFQDDENLFMVLDLMLGGDLRFHLDRLGTLPEKYVQFYAAEIALSINYLHNKNIIHRDLKPDNILLDEKGHAHLSDFNIAVGINQKRIKPLTAIAGSLAYISPEILNKQGYSFSVDWWSLGIVIYELLYGQRPFKAKSNEELQKSIMSDPIEFPIEPKVSPEAVSFIQGLLNRNISQRLGVGELGLQHLKAHPWMKNIDWNILATKTISAPFIPDEKKSNFDPTHELEEVLLEGNPLKVKKRAFQAKRNISDGAIIGEKQVLEEKFLSYDYTKPEYYYKREIHSLPKLSMPSSRCKRKGEHKSSMDENFPMLHKTPSLLTPEFLSIGPNMLHKPPTAAQNPHSKIAF